MPLLPESILLFAAAGVFVGGALFPAARRFPGIWSPVALAGAATAMLFASQFDARIFRRNELTILIEWTAVGLGILAVMSSAKREVVSTDAPSTSLPPTGAGQACLLLTVAAMMFAGLAGNVVVLYAAVEVCAFAVVFQTIANAPSREERAAAVVHLKTSAFAGVLLFLGVAFVCGTAGSIEFAALRTRLSAGLTPFASEGASSPALIGVVLIATGLGFRLSLPPFHFGIWEVDMPVASRTTRLILSATALVAMTRLAGEALGGVGRAGGLLTAVWAVAAFSIGSVGATLAASRNAVEQHELARILTRVKIAVAGFALTAVAVAFYSAAAPALTSPAAGSFPGGFGTLLYLTATDFPALVGIYSILAYLRRTDRDVEYIDDLAGLFRTEPAAATCLVLLLLSLAGAPPLAGFWSRMLTVSAVFSVHTVVDATHIPGLHPAFVLLGLLTVVSMILLAVPLVRIVGTILFEPPAGLPRPAGSQAALAGGVLAAAYCVGVGLLPGPMLGCVERASRSAEQHEPQVSRTTPDCAEAHKLTVAAEPPQASQPPTRQDPAKVSRSSRMIEPRGVHDTVCDFLCTRARFD